jgi:hypothetical protein
MPTARVDEAGAVGCSWVLVGHEGLGRKGGSEVESRAPCPGRGTGWSADVVVLVATTDEAAKCKLALRFSCSHNLDHHSICLCTAAKVWTLKLIWQVVTAAVDYHSGSQACCGLERHDEWLVAEVVASWRQAASEKCSTWYCWYAMSSQSHWRHLVDSGKRRAASSAWSTKVVCRRLFAFHHYHRWCSPPRSR